MAPVCKWQKTSYTSISLAVPETVVYVDWKQSFINHVLLFNIKTASMEIFDGALISISFTYDFRPRIC